ncbi:MAG: HEAT repeat domain-containing protein [Gammaproteobacteria bacterium]|nr:HEAT repeat domain-containing protein [Gammaproteobacteria bacterium]
MSNKVINSLLNYLENGDEVDRCYAAKTLGNLKIKEATKALLERLKDEDVNVCIDAISALGKIKEPSVLPSLLKSLEKNPDIDVKFAITESLAHYQSKEAINTLLKLAEKYPKEMNFDQNEDSDSWWDLQEKAIVILGEMKVKAAYPVLKNILEDDVSQDIEAIILKALAKLEDPDADEYLINRMNGTDNDSTEVQQRGAATALGFSNTKTTLQALGRSLVSNSADIRENVLYALGKRKATPYIKVVVLSLRDPAANVKRAALQVLQDLSTEPQSNKRFNFNQIAIMLEEQDATLQAAILAFFQEQQKLNSVVDSLSEESLQLINQCLKSDNDNVLAQAAQLARITSNPKSVDLLFNLASNDDCSAWVRKEAILALGQTLDTINDADEKKNALLNLRALIQNEEQAVRSSTIQALLDLSNSSDIQEESLPPILILLTTLRGEQFNLQGDEACETGDNTHLFSIDEAQNINSTISTLEAIMWKNFSKGKKIVRCKIDTYSDARRICARLLSSNTQKKYDELIVNALSECLNDDDENLREEAIESLSNISLKNPLVPGLNNIFGQLVTLLDSKNSDIRLACIHAIAHSGNRAALPHLIDYLSDENYLVQLHALNGLVYILKNKANLTEAQQIEHMTINNISNEQIIEVLFDCLQAKNYSVSMATIEALSDLQQKSAIEQIIDIALTDEGQSVRHISELLKRLDTEKSTEFLLTRLNTMSDSSYRRYVMEMLEVIISPDNDHKDVA